MPNRTDGNRNYYGQYWLRFRKHVETYQHEFQIEFSKELVETPKEQTYYLKVRGYDLGKCRVVFDVATKRRPYHVSVGIDIERSPDLYREIWGKRDWIEETLGIKLQNRGTAQTVKRLYVECEVADPKDEREEQKVFAWMCKQALKMRLLIVKYAWD